MQFNPNCGSNEQETGMAQEQDGMAKGLIVGFIAGSIVGAAIALLYAPKPGKELRADIKEKAGDLIDDAQVFIDKARSKASDIINDGKRKAETLVDDARRQADSILGDADRIISGAKSKDSNRNA
jgi:gas vesicle protein